MPENGGGGPAFAGAAAGTVEIVHALYQGFFERGVRYFFPDATLTAAGVAGEFRPTLAIHTHTDGGLDLEWMGLRYTFERGPRPFTENQVRLVGAVGAVLSTRYRGIFHAESAASATQLFEGLAEDRYVSAFLNPAPYLNEDVLPVGRDVIADALEVLRESSLITYENRRISTGVVLVQAAREHAAVPAAPPEGAMPYNSALVPIKSFHRVCDGLHTVFLVDRNGLLVDLVDIRQFANDRSGVILPAPSPARWHAHSLATLRRGNICLVLTPNGEIKVFAGGVQIFNFLEGRWRLTDLTEKYHAFNTAVGDAALAERLFTAGLNLAEHRRGALFVVLDHPELARDLVAPEDLLDRDTPSNSQKGQIHYLLRGKRVLGIEQSVLQSIARMDGGIVLDRTGRLLAFGAILRNSSECARAQEGGRTTAAVHASRSGAVLKISEDGIVAYYRGGACAWEI